MLLFLVGSSRNVSEATAKKKLEDFGTGCLRKNNDGLYSVFFLSPEPKLHKQHPWLGDEDDTYVGCEKPDENSKDFRTYMAAQR